MTRAAVEPFEDFLGLAVREPFAPVGNLDPDHATGLRRTDRDWRAGGRVFHRILNDLAQRAFDQCGVNIDQRQIVGDIERDRTVAKQAPQVPEMRSSGG